MCVDGYYITMKVSTRFCWIDHRTALLFSVYMFNCGSGILGTSGLINAASAEPSSPKGELFHSLS